MILAFLVISVYFKENTKFEDLALGEHTSSYQGRADTNLIHVIRINEQEESSLVNGWKDRGQKKLIFCFGNSQSSSINQMKEGDVVYPELLHRRFEQEGNLLEVLCHSIPNANLQELLLSFEYWRGKLPIQAITLPVFMDDLREEGIRGVFFPNLITSKYQIVDSSEAIVQQINQSLRKLKSVKNSAGGAEKTDMAALNETVQEKSETYLNDWLNVHFSPWAYRPNVRGAMFNDLYLLRNTAFGITAETKRKMIPQRYQENIDALKVILNRCQNLGIKVVLYIPPIRNDVEVPYNLKEYNNFKQEIANLANINHCTFYNWESIVPAKLWGLKGSTNGTGKPELDYMHFQCPGHIILSDSLYSALKSLGI